MTKKDYELLADLIGKANINPQDKLELANNFCVELLTQNCRFNPEAFKKRVLTWF